MAGAHSSGTGFHPHLPGFKHKFLATTLGATLWFFVFYRMRKDGSKMLGIHPWDAHGAGHDDHGHAEHKEHH